MSSTPEVSSIHWAQDDDGIVVLTMDDPTQRANTANELFTRSFAAVVDRLEAAVDSVRGVVLTSAKPTFFAGGDLNRFLRLGPADRETFLADLRLRKSRTRRLEQLGRPVVAALGGAALGGGLELALACHRRVGVAGSRLVVGLPEVTLGLLPGAGGVVRTTRMLGLERALTELVVNGRPVTAGQALDIGLLDELVDDPADLVERARRWILSDPASTQPWERPGFALPGPRLDEGELVERVQRALPRISLAPCSLDPTPRVIVDLAMATTETDLDTAFDLESEALADLVCGTVAKAKIRVVFFDTTRLRSAERRPSGDAGRSGRLVVAVSGEQSRAAADLLSASRHVSVVDLSGLDPAAVAERLRASLGPDDCLVWAAGLDGQGTTREIVSVARSVTAGPVCVCLADAAPAPAGTVGVRLLPDLLSGTGAVVELEVPDDGSDTGPVFDAFTRAGAVPVLLRAGRGPFGARLHRALDQESRTLVADGVDPDDVRAVRHLAGFGGSSAPDVTGRPVPRAPELARRLIRAVAAEAAAARADHVLVHPEDLDVAAVRAGGFPAWTGGPDRWRQGTPATGSQDPAQPG